MEPDNQDNLGADMGAWINERQASEDREQQRTAEEERRISCLKALATTIRQGRMTGIGRG